MPSFYTVGTITDRDIESVYVRDIINMTKKIRKDGLTKQKDLGLWKPEKNGVLNESWD